MLEYFGIPKPGAEDPSQLSAMRWIAKSAAGQKLFLRCVVNRMERLSPRTDVATCGFERHMQSAHVVDTLRQALCDVERWGGEVFVASADILFCVDTMSHEAISWGMLKRSCPHN